MVATTIMLLKVILLIFKSPVSLSWILGDVKPVQSKYPLICFQGHQTI